MRGVQWKYPGILQGQLPVVMRAQVAVSGSTLRQWLLDEGSIGGKISSLLHAYTGQRLEEDEVVQRIRGNL